MIRQRIACLRICCGNCNDVGRENRKYFNLELRSAETIMAFSCEQVPSLIGSAGHPGGK